MYAYTQNTLKAVYYRACAELLTNTRVQFLVSASVGSPFYNHLSHISISIFFWVTPPSCSRLKFHFSRNRLIHPSVVSSLGFSPNSSICE